MGYWTTLTRSQLLHDAWRLDTYEGIHTFTLVMRGSRKGEEIEDRSERSRPHSLNKSNFFNSEKNPKTNKETKKKNQTPDKQTKQNTRKLFLGTTPSSSGSVHA